MKTNQVLIPVALSFLIIELSYINAKSLIYLNNATDYVNIGFAVIGSIAFSAVTILVMLNGVIQWPKYIFPVFDTGLMFLGLNLRHFDNLLSDPGRLYITAFMSLLTGFITYSLGLIEFKSLKTDSNVKDSELKERLNSLGLKYDSVKREFNSLECQMNSDQKQIELYKTEIEQLKSELKDKQCNIDKMESVYIKAECSRIKKRKKNATPEELKFLSTHEPVLDDVA